MPAVLYQLLLTELRVQFGGGGGGVQLYLIKPLSAVFLVFIPSVSITLMTQIGTLFFSLFPAHVFSILSFLLLFFLGFEKLLEYLIRRLSEAYPDIIGNWTCKIKQLNIIFTIYFSPEEANRQEVQVLSGKEALFLSLALSLDSVLASMAFSCQVTSLPFLFLSAVFFHFLLFLLGYLSGLLLSKKFSLDLSWLSGLFLLLLALGTLL